MKAKEKIVVWHTYNANKVFNLYLNEGIVDEDIMDISTAKNGGQYGLLIACYRMDSFIRYAGLLEKRLMNVDPAFMNEVSEIYRRTASIFK